MNNYRDIIKAPIITEKTSELASKNIITFSVDVNANKTQIKQAIEAINALETGVKSQQQTKESQMQGDK